VLRLKLANPERVLLARGNHEDVRLAATYGLLDEGAAKYGARFNARKLCRTFDFLPAAIYLGCGTNFVQCNHGGVEPGFHPGALLDAPPSAQFQLIGALRQRAFFDRHPDFRHTVDSAAWPRLVTNFLDCILASPTEPAHLGFMWNDFTVATGEPVFDFDPSRGAVFGEAPTRFILERSAGQRAGVRAIFRAHQHTIKPSPIMRRLIASRGVFRHWQPGDSTNLLDAPISLLAGRLDTDAERSVPPGSVWTFTVSPDTPYGAGCGFDFDALGIVRVSERFEDWRLRVVTLRE
jgi:hypothetical protein